MDEAPCASETPSVTPCVDETPATDEVPSTSEPPYASGVFTGEPACVLPGTPCVKGAPQPETARVCEPPRVCETPRVSAPVGVSGVVCVDEAPGVSERPRVVRVTACVRSLYTREMTVAMHDHAAASPRVSAKGIVCSLGLVARGSVSARREWRRRLRLWRAKCRVAAVLWYQVSSENPWLLLVGLCVQRAVAERDSNEICYLHFP